MAAKNKKALLVSSLVIVAIVFFIVYQNRKTNSSDMYTGRDSQSSEQPVVRIAYQTGIDPTKVAQADALYSRQSHRQIQWKKFDTGADVINALASGDIDIGNIGSSPFAAATSRNLPIDVFLVASQLGASEALVVRKGAGIQSPQDLIGKTIAVPFVSTTHYSLLAALKHWGISAQQVKIINLRPPEIAAAWTRGNIDAAYVWEPTLSRIKATGTVLTDSHQVGEWGAPTFDLWVVRKAFAKENPDFLRSFTSTSFNVFDQYLHNPASFTENLKVIEKIAALTGSKVEDVKTYLAGNIYLNRAQQQVLFQQHLEKNIADTAAFLKQQGKIDQVKSSYADNINASFLPQQEHAQ